MRRGLSAVSDGFLRLSFDMRLFSPLCTSLCRGSGMEPLLPLLLCGIAPLRMTALGDKPAGCMSALVSGLVSCSASGSFLLADLLKRILNLRPAELGFLASSGELSATLLVGVERVSIVGMLSKSALAETNCGPLILRFLADLRCESWRRGCVGPADVGPGLDVEAACPDEGGSEEAPWL